jgi:hypothetical protein
VNKLGWPRGIGGNAFPLHVAGKVLFRGFQKGWNEKEKI